MQRSPNGREPDLKSGDGESHCGFESYTLRHVTVAERLNAADC